MEEGGSKHNRVTFFGIIAALFLVAMGGVLWFFISRDSGATSWTADIKSFLSSSGGDAGASTVPADWLTYNNERYGFSFLHPPNLAFQEVEQEGDSMTIVFQKPDAREGFQVYITPHGLDTIDGATILRDVPYGEIEDLKEEYLREDLLVATFWSNSPFAGRAREIWFLHNGYIFEFTSYDVSEDLLRSVLATLKLEV